MTKKRQVQGILVMALICGITITGCDRETNGGDTGPDNNGGEKVLFNKRLTRSNPEIRVATYNVAAGAGNFTVDLQLTAAAITKINPDIIALQEIDRYTNRSDKNQSGKVDQIAILSTLTGYHYAFGKAIDFQEGEYGIAVLSKHPILDSSIIRLPFTNTLTQKAEEPRIALVCKVAVPGFEVPVTFINTHLDWHEDPNVRLQQVRTINEITLDMRGIKILAGDFNDTLNSVIGAEMQRYWTTVFNKKIDRRTWPAVNPEVAIDQIFLNNAQVWKVKKVYVPNTGTEKDADWKKVSDHIPVIVDLKLLEY